MFRLFVSAALLTASAFAQAPLFEAAKVQIPNSNDTTPLSPGELILVYGSSLGPDTPCQGREDPNQSETPNPRRSLSQGNNLRVFPKELCGVRVLVGVKHMPRDYYYQTNSLLGTLVTAYQADALPYVKRVIQETDNKALRDVAGSALVYADLPEVWAFIAEAIAEDAPYKADVLRHIAARYPASNATEAAMLALAKRLAAGQEP